MEQGATLISQTTALFLTHHRRNRIMRKLSIHICLLLLVAISAFADITFLSDRDGNRSIYVMNDDGSDVRRLTDTPFKMSNPTWSPDGRQIAFMMDIETDPQKWQQYDVFVMNADGSRQRNLTEHPALDGLPSWSPDGKYIAFISGRAAHATSEIFVMELASRNVEKITKLAYVTSVSWSPDGKAFAYEFITPGAGRHIYIMDANGRRERPLLRRPRHGVFGGTLLSFDPQWSPDGKHILYTESEFAPGKGRVANSILIVNTNTRHIEVLDTPKKWRIEGACWADNGDAILFAAVRNGLVNKSNIFNIYKYQLSNGQITNLTEHPSDNWGMDWTPQNSRSVSARTKITTQWASIKTDGISTTRFGKMH
jgi:TolB protein